MLYTEAQRARMFENGIQVRASGYSKDRLNESTKELLEWAKGNRREAISSLKREIQEGRFIGPTGVYHKDLLDHMTQRQRGMER
jgi:hypothetical protein